MVEKKPSTPLKRQSTRGGASAPAVADKVSEKVSKQVETKTKEVKKSAPSLKSNKDSEAEKKKKE